jgi:hypothetical protein
MLINTLPLITTSYSRSHCGFTTPIINSYDSSYGSIYKVHKQLINILLKSDISGPSLKQKGSSGYSRFWEGLGFGEDARRAIAGGLELSEEAVQSPKLEY